MYYNEFMSSKKKKISPSDLNGISIYHEEKRTVYSPFFSKKAYIINENNAGQYVSYIQGYLIALIIFVVSYIIYRKPLIPVLLTLMFMASTIFIFYRNFLSKANTIDDYKKPKRASFAIRQASSLSQEEIWTIIIASPLLAAAIMYNAHLNHYEGVMYYFMLFISIVALAYGILHIYILIIKKNQEL